MKDYIYNRVSGNELTNQGKIIHYPSPWDSKAISLTVRLLESAMAIIPPEALYKQPQHFPDHHNNKPTKIFLTKVCFQSVFCFPNPTLVTTTLPSLSFETSFFLFPNQTSKRYSLIITEIMAPNITTVKTTITDAQAKVATDHGRAYVTFLAGNGDYVKGVVGLAKGLRKVKSMYPLVVAVLPDVPEHHRNILTSQGCIVREIEPVYPPENQTQFAMAYYVINYSKLRIWEVRK